jgi:membrane protein implicated in regulation of membrane protease activity
VKDGAHTHHGHGGGGGGVALVIVALLAAAAVAKPLESAARTAGHVLAVALEVAFISVAVLAAAAVAAVLTWAGVRLRRRYANRAAAADRRPLNQPIQVVAEVVRDEPQAIEGPALRASCPYDICHHNHEEVGRDFR